jgi:hypothetical protein
LKRSTPALLASWNASHVYLAAFVGNHEDPYNGARALLNEAREIYAELRLFLDRHQPSLPPAAAGSLSNFLSTNATYFEAHQPVAGPHGMKILVPALAAIRSNLAYQLRDFSAAARHATERGLVHLQRSLVADPGLRQKWCDAFTSGELACEKLGAAHLLQHGVWAFKAHAEGERTDLILGEPIENLSQVEAVAIALVLTEWKMVGKPSESEKTARIGAKSLVNSGTLPPCYWVC